MISLHPLPPAPVAPFPSSFFTLHNLFGVRKVVYNNDVVVFGTPLLTLRVGDAPNYDSRAVYSSGSGTSTLVFEYTVQVRHTYLVRGDMQIWFPYSMKVEVI